MPQSEWFPINEPGLVSNDAKPKRTLLRVKISSKTLCLVYHKDQWHALDAKCPHSGGPLDGGFVNDKNQIVCPWHRFGFDLITGTSDSGGYFVNTYPMKVEGKQLWVQLPVSWWSKWF